MTWRYYAQRALTNTWLNRDLELNDVDINWQLSGPGALTAVVDESIATVLAIDDRRMLDRWSTLIYAEENDEIRWGGIVKDTADQGDGRMSIECTSFSGYPKGRIYTDYHRLWLTDAFNIVRYIWEWVQSDTYGNLDVLVSSALSGVTIGAPENTGARPVQGPNEASAVYQTRLQAWETRYGQPYELAWWNSPDCGDEIENLMTEAAGEYVENHAWASDEKDEIYHLIDLHAQYAGSRRTDLRFIEGENIVIAPRPEIDGDIYANYVRALGAGEDRTTLFAEAARIDGRLRRDFIVPVKNVLSPSLLASIAKDSLLLAQDIMRFDSIQVFNHPNAAIGSWSLGDDIRIQAFSGAEPIDVWARVTGWSLQPGTEDVATIDVMSLA